MNTATSVQPAQQEWKPDEPRGLGGVVEDSYGKLWVRDAEFRDRWYNPKDGWRRDYADITAVRVLAPGVVRAAQ